MVSTGYDVLRKSYLPWLGKEMLEFAARWKSDDVLQSIAFNCG